VDNDSKTAKTAKTESGFWRRAEQPLGATRASEGSAPAAVAQAVENMDAERLVHELQVHRIELEMQNDELRASRNEVESSHARYTELFEFAPVGFGSLGRDGTIRELNHAAARLLGNERDRLTGVRLRALLVPDDRGEFDRALMRACLSAHFQSCELRLAGLSAIEGRSVQFRLSATVLANGEQAVLVAMVDVTGRKMREEELARAQDALLEASRLKDESLELLAHELRNPLAPIRNSLFVLDRAEPGSPQARKAREVIERQVKQLARLVDDLHDVSRMARGELTLQPEPLDLEALVRRTIDDHIGGLDARGIGLEAHFERAPSWVEGDAARIVQVLSNLFSNAEKFIQRGDRIVVTLRHEHRTVMLRVRKTGVGSVPDVVQSLYHAFEKSPHARGGLGLGLATVKGLVELQGGSVAVENSGSGHGNEIRISLPLVDPPADVRAPPAEHVTCSRRVLVIEDNRDSAESLKDALEFYTHQVSIAYDGPSGIAIAREFKPEVVLCDIGLPGMDGYEVAGAFRADPTLRDTYLVALTGYAMADDLERSLAAGFDQHVAKPLPLEAIDRIVTEAVVGGRRGIAAA
jgi:PAS domain S-box-containing protein